MEKIIQIACAESNNYPAALFALSDTGDIYMRYMHSDWKKVKSPFDAEEAETI